MTDQSEKRRRFLTRRRLMAASTASIAGAMGFYAWRVEPHWLEIVRRPMSIANLPNALVGSTLLHVSDLHIGPRVDDDYLARVFNMVNKLAPDIVVYTGDFVNHDADLRNHAPKLLSQLPNGERGTFGVLGNHDYGSAWRHGENAETIASIVEGAGVQILRNESATVDGLTIHGLDDLWANHFAPGKVFPNAKDNQPAVALVHNPDAVDAVGWEDFSGWILAGHTHGGQCKLPFLPPPYVPVRNKRYTCGHFDLNGNRKLWISRGVGYLHRIRFSVRPEITLFTLES